MVREPAAARTSEPPAPRESREEREGPREDVAGDPRVPVISSWRLTACRHRLVRVVWSPGDAQRGAARFRARAGQPGHVGAGASGQDLGGVTWLAQGPCTDAEPARTRLECLGPEHGTESGPGILFPRPATGSFLIGLDPILGLNVHRNGDVRCASMTLRMNKQ